MRILGIETSCDETAAAVVKDGRDVLSNIIATSLKEHQKFGGIIPEIASRRQLEFIGPVVQSALKDAGCTLDDIEAVAVTRSPGLIGSLLVGISYARALSYALNRPLIEVDHVKSHLYANFLHFAPSRSSSTSHPQPKLPAVGLIVSGGHTSLYLIRDFLHFKLIGQTRDDAAGEAFDKVARILGLGFPGGPVIDRLAQATRPDPSLRFPQSDLKGSFDFSFSGVKTSVLYHTRRHQDKPGFNKEKIARAFQDSVVSVLVQKSMKACLVKKVKTLLIGGGVAANSSLRERLTSETRKLGICVYFPPMSLCLDNAAMIAGLGYHIHKKELRG